MNIPGLYLVDKLQYVINNIIDFSFSTIKLPISSTCLQLIDI